MNETEQLVFLGWISILMMALLVYMCISEINKWWNYEKNKDN